jgi:hypothetical protein
MYKIAASAATSLTFTITVTTPNFGGSNAGVGYDLTGHIDAGSNITELMREDFFAQYQRTYNSTAVVHDAGLQNYGDNLAPGTAVIIPTIATVSTTTSSSGNNVETITITIPIASAGDSVSSYAHCKFHITPRQVYQVVLS